MIKSNNSESRRAVEVAIDNIRECEELVEFLKGTIAEYDAHMATIRANKRGAEEQLEVALHRMKKAEAHHAQISKGLAPLSQVGRAPQRNVEEGS